MKSYALLIALLCTIFIHSIEESEGEGWEQINYPSKENCTNGLSDSDKKAGYEKCCFFRGKLVEEKKRCMGFTKYQFEHLVDFIGQYKFSAGTDDLNIDCGSVYFKFGLISLICLISLI